LERSRRRRPSAALVVACLALFVALGGTVLAATKIDGHTIKVKSLPGNRVAVASLPGNRLQPGTISGDRLAPKSINGSQIDIATLGQVPSADHAGSAETARRADTATAADHAADASTINGHSVGCAEGRREFAGACWDVHPSSTIANASEAAALCAATGGELPEALTLLAFMGQPGTGVGVTDEWTNGITDAGPTFGATVIFLDAASKRLEGTDASGSMHFRCVTPLLH
jgi:hypothetical protein